MKKLSVGWLIFLLVFALEALVGYYVTSVKGYVMNDAMYRVANAFYVWNISPPHLASIGFVWPPLPSFIEIFILLLKPFFAPLASSAFTGTILTAAFTAVTAGILWGNARHFKLPVWLATILLILFVFNPFIFIYGFNGMSEAVFIFTVVLAVTQLVQWIDDNAPYHLIWIALALALGFLTRYEVVAFAFAILIAIAIIASSKDRKPGADNTRYGYFEGTALVVFIPLLVAVGVWILANYLIMGDPLYFYRSNYSNLAQSHNIGPGLVLSIVGNFTGVAKFVFVETGVFLIPFAVVLIARLFTGKLFRRDMLILLLLVASIPALQALLLFRGNSYGWLRFFVYPLPILFAWVPYEYARMKNRWLIVKTVGMSFICVSLLVTAVGTGWVMTKGDISPEEYNTYVKGSNSWVSKRQVSDYINRNIGDSTLLLDTTSSAYIILNLDSTKKVVTNCSLNFGKCVLDPHANGIDYLLVADPLAENNYDQIGVTYPTLYANGADWCTLVAAFQGFKLYKIN